MGNSSSRPNTPGGGSPHAGPSQATDKRRPARRKESIGGLSGKGTAAAPTASLESATGRSSKSSSQTRSSAADARGRSTSTLPSHPKSESASLGEKSTTSHSKSPRPPLNVDTSSPAPPDCEPLTRTTSSSQSGVLESPTPFYGPHSQFGRAPRLPLPIEEEDFAPGSPAPGSPVLAAADFTREPRSTDKDVPRSRSVASATTIDEEDEEEDDAIYRAEEVTGPLVDTLIEWKEGGERVYVTGTFCGWAKKSRLHKNGPSKDPSAFSAIIPIPPGTVYLAFLVDGIAMTAKQMPTTVDYANSLVNYLQVPPEGTPQPVVPKENPRSQAAPVPTSEARARGSTSAQPPTPDMRPVSKSEAHGVPSPATLPSRTTSVRQRPAGTSSTDSDRPKFIEKRKRPNTAKYHTEIPKYLLHWDAPENSSKGRRANAVSNTHPAPPQLPPYLSKSILSVQTPMKDDASVLTLPNHTVLNHLATSSIRDGVLGTSATTRYKRKFVTTIMYMPTSSSTGG